MAKPATDLLGDIEVDVEKSKRKKLKKTIIKLIVFAMVMATLQMVFLKFGHQYYRRTAFFLMKEAKRLCLMTVRESCTCWVSRLRTSFSAIPG